MPGIVPTPTDDMHQQHCARSSDFDQQCDEMVDTLLVYATVVAAKIGRAAVSTQVLEVIRSTPRHCFVPAALQKIAYADSPLPIGHGRTLPQPFIVALMSSLLDLESEDRVLEVGTGLGYQTAVLAHLAKEVFSVEIIEDLAHNAERNLTENGIDNVRIGIGDGINGWPKHAPFNKILVTAAPDLIPVDLLQQLAPGGRMVIPAGLKGSQQLILAQRDQQGAYHTSEILGVQFPPLTEAT